MSQQTKVLLILDPPFLPRRVCRQLVPSARSITQLHCFREGEGGWTHVPDVGEMFKMDPVELTARLEGAKLKGRWVTALAFPFCSSCSLPPASPAGWDSFAPNLLSYP